MPSLWNVEEQTVKTLPDNIIKIKFTELGLKNKPYIGTKKNTDKLCSMQYIIGRICTIKKSNHEYV
jgi:hypothetical protein